MPSLIDRLCLARARLRKHPLRWLSLVVVVAAAVTVWINWYGAPVDYPDPSEQFKYGSTGSDHPLARGLPYWIWKVLPDMFPPAQALPEGFRPTGDKKGYEAFGLITEAKMDRPIGFSERSVFGIKFVGLNCAFCHVSTIRGQNGKREIVLGGTGTNVDIEKYFLFVFAATGDPRFTSDAVMQAILKQNPDMGWLERVAYRLLVPLVRHIGADVKKNFDFIDPANPQRLPVFGPGRVDTWAAYKRVFVHPPERDHTAGMADFPPIWNQKARQGMRLHWDGNTDVLQERNIISALGAIGPRVEYLDFPRLTRITDWTVGLLPPRYADWAARNGYPPVHWGLAESGWQLFRVHCAECHAADGNRVGRVEPLEYLGTDPGRIQAFTPTLADALDRLGTHEWQLRRFRTQHGYANMLLDGIWLRAPYLHNGSVPTLHDLLSKPDKRPPQFCRGSDEYDSKNVGFVARLPDAARGCGELFLYDTSVAGNGNAGHLFGTELSGPEKDALIEYLKTL